MSKKEKDDTRVDVYQAIKLLASRKHSHLVDLPLWKELYAKAIAGAKAPASFPDIKGNAFISGDAGGSLFIGPHRMHHKFPSAISTSTALYLFKCIYEGKYTDAQSSSYLGDYIRVTLTSKSDLHLEAGAVVDTYIKRFSTFMLLTDLLRQAIRVDAYEGVSWCLNSDGSLNLTIQVGKVRGGDDPTEFEVARMLEVASRVREGYDKYIRKGVGLGPTRARILIDYLRDKCTDEQLPLLSVDNRSYGQKVARLLLAHGDEGWAAIESALKVN